MPVQGPVPRCDRVSVFRHPPPRACPRHGRYVSLAGVVGHCPDCRRSECPCDECIEAEVERFLEEAQAP